MGHYFLETQYLVITVCPRSSDPFHIQYVQEVVTPFILIGSNNYYIKRVTTSWTHSIVCKSWYNKNNCVLYNLQCTYVCIVHTMYSVHYTSFFRLSGHEGVIFRKGCVYFYLYLYLITFIADFNYIFMGPLNATVCPRSPFL